MKKYDVIVVGSGSGMLIVDEATDRGLKVALVDKGPFGGTCLNTGCIPSKMLIYPADRIVEIQEAKKLGIEAQTRGIDFSFIMQRMRNSIQESQSQMRRALSQAENLDFYEGEGHFVGEYTIEVNGDKIKGENIVLASGSRPFIPPIKGLDSVDYLTNETLLQLEELPDSLIIIGGGYIGVEFGHFFAATGTKVTILEMMDSLVPVEEPEIYDLLKEQLRRRMDVYTNAQAEEVNDEGGMVKVAVRDRNTSEKREFTAQRILVAVGRRSNADLLKVENTGVEIDGRGFIRVNEYLETSKKNIFAIGDANGQQMFTHVANREALVVVQNMFYSADLKMDYNAIPHAVYSHPQIASVGLTEAQARKEYDMSVGRVRYFDVAKGEAMMEEEGFAKAIVEKASGRILGFHIIGPYAPVLIQEVVNAMTSGGQIDEINEGIHIHPALSELIQTTVNSLEAS
ncbi:MAG: dihydrolipoyl dehydrogenase [Dehalococcoidia bacterium]|nr:MAG: dihydrolipoyl dehydrogenase [Dehalococcoidia bacterium]